MGEAWRKMKLDALVCPAGAFPAPPLKSADLLLGRIFNDKKFYLSTDQASFHGIYALVQLKIIRCACLPIFPASQYVFENECTTFSAGGSYLMLYNVLDYPGGVVRMTSVTEEDNESMRNYPDHDVFHRRVKQVMNFVVIYQK